MGKFKHKKQFRKSTKPALFALFYVILSLPVPSNAQTACSRADIDHYLGKGFTPAQITSICTNSRLPQALNSKDAAPNSQDSAAIKADPPERGVRQDVQASHGSKSFFADTIEGYDVVVMNDTLAYTRKKCYDLGEEDLFGFAPEVCPEVRYRINLNGLEILPTSKKYFLFGAAGITVKGKINREVLSGLQDLPAQGKKTIKKLVGSGDEEFLPIRYGIPRDRVAAELKKLLR